MGTTTEIQMARRTLTPKHFETLARYVQSYATDAGEQYRDRYDLVEFSAQDLCNSVMVVRRLQHRTHSSIAQVQCFIIGAKGGVKVVYDRISY
jgi:hypothetical protein